MGTEQLIRGTNYTPHVPQVNSNFCKEQFCERGRDVMLDTGAARSLIAAAKLLVE